MFAALNPPPSHQSTHQQFLKGICTSTGKLLGGFLSSRRGWRTASQTRHATPSPGTESQRSTRPPHPRSERVPGLRAEQQRSTPPRAAPRGAQDGCGPQELTITGLLPPLPAALAPQSNYHCKKFLSILPHRPPGTQTSLMHSSEQAEHPRTGTKDDCRDPPRRRHQLAATAASSGGRGQPGSQHSPAPQQPTFWEAAV